MRDLPFSTTTSTHISKTIFRLPLYSPACLPVKMGAVCSENEGNDIPDRLNQRKVQDVPAEPVEQSPDDVLTSFKEAAHEGHEELVMHLDQNYPKLNLLETVFESGDSVLHIAVRNRNNKLLIYCLENGLHVE